MNHTLIRLCAVLLLLSLGLFWHKPAEAQVVTCAVTSMSNFDFGTINPPAAAVTVSGQLDYSCNYVNSSSNQPISVAICFGLGQNTGTRNLTSGTNTLPFQLYTASPPNGSIWGNSPYVPLQGTLTHIPANGSLSGTLTPYVQLSAVPAGTVAGLYTDVFASIPFTYTTSSGSSNPPSCVNAGASGTAPGFTVQAQINAACTVNAATLDFGTLKGVLTSAVSNTSSVSVQCANGIYYNVGLDGGLNSGNNINARKMVMGANSVAYQLYRDSGLTQVWGNTVGTNTVAGTGDGSIQPLTVYGKVPAQTTPPAGAYQDTVVVSVTY